ncbi:MAG TPA: hypothetical protein VFT67_06225 [Jatrophihabitantaceae bacterium]|nr:hypothetical protein [Jatrophihabitantaceae bacterium]
MLKSLLSGLVATKVIAGVAGAAAVGGVALAASTGHLGDGGHSADAPGQAIAAAHQPGATDSVSMSSSSDDSSSAASSESSSSSSSASSTHAPTPSLVGLCHAWQAHEQSQSDHSASAAHSAWAKSPAFSVLVSTAGGTDGVDGYCAALLTPSTSASTTPTSVPPTHPAHPTQAVTTHANHKPSAVPSHSHPAPSHTNHKPTATASASATPSA